MSTDDLPLELDDLAPFSYGIGNLAKMAEKEDWKCKDDEYGILKNMLRFQYRQLRTQKDGIIKHFVDGSEKPILFMNSSLLDRSSFEEIYIMYKPDTQGREHPYNIPKFICESDSNVPKGVRPQLVEWDIPIDLRVWNSKISFTANTEHIVGERAERFPKSMKDMNVRIAMFEKALKYAEEKCLRNRFIIAPFVHLAKCNAANQNFQAILPLTFDFFGEKKITHALVVERLEFGYRAATIISLEMAFLNTRVVGRQPDWLLETRKNGR